MEPLRRNVAVNGCTVSLTESIWMLPQLPVKSAGAAPKPVSASPSSVKLTVESPGNAVTVRR